MRPRPLPVLLGMLVLAGRAGAGAFDAVSESELATAVSAKVYGGYGRVRAPDGSFRPETYVFGNGGQVEDTAAGSDVAAIDLQLSGPGTAEAGRIASDPTIDRVGFTTIATTIRAALADQHYVASSDPKATQLLVMVYWGRAQGVGHVYDGGFRDAIDARNAALMGFGDTAAIQGREDAGVSLWGRSLRMNLLDNTRAPEVGALEENRYFVILRAFDFQAAWRHKQLRLLWETRFSLSERAHDFGRDLPAMAQSAARYFGVDTHGLVTSPLPEGRVDIGEVKSLGTVPQK